MADPDQFEDCAWDNKGLVKEKPEYDQEALHEGLRAEMHEMDGSRPFSY